MKVETEKKYYCIEPQKLIKLAESLKFKCTNESIETDEYFTDIDSNFIKNRTCLRIRKINNDIMEITYKGKSDSLLGQFCKLENNISLDINNYDNCLKLFSSLGYYSYVEVLKKRITYELEDKKYKYSIMIDTLPEIGGYVEFELISEQSSSNKNKLKNELDNFVHKFDELNLKEATQPYRDIVANHIYNKKCKKNNIKNLCIDLSNVLLNYEKDFYKKYREMISSVCNSNVKWGEYKKNSDVDKKIEPLIKEYLENLIFDGNELLVTIELLKKIPYEKYFLTNTNKTFFNCFLNKLNINNKNIIFVKSNETIISVLNKNNISIEDSILVTNKNLKNNNSLLLIMINELQL